MRALTLAALLGLALGAAPAHAEEAWRATGADVRVTCPLTVGGSFEARTAALSGSVGPAGEKLSGELVVDLKSLDTGIGLRNEHLRGTYLEVARGADYDTARLSGIHLAAANLEAFQGRTTFTGILRLHGVSKAVDGTAELRREGNVVRVSAAFPVRLSDFAIAEPRYLGVGVKDEVRVAVTFAATEVR